MNIVFTQKQIKIILIISGILLVTVIYLLIRLNNEKKSKNFFSTREQNGNYVFTNPLLDFELPQEYSNSIVSGEVVRNFVEKLKEEKEIGFISVYFRDLNNGPWIGVNEKEYFSPASLLKTPIFIAFLKWAQDDPRVLKSIVKVAPGDFKENINQNIETKNGAILGQEYTLFEIAVKMIQESDNVSANIIYKNIPNKYIQDVFSSIGVNLVTDTQDSLIRVKDIAAFFRVLFNSSYLDREFSEQALAILSSTSYQNGIVAGVPVGISVAHKFGERTASGLLLNKGLIEESETQLHDCGIVYFPKKPYILCIMTRGEDLEQQQLAISEISKFFYEHVKKSK